MNIKIIAKISLFGLILGLVIAPHLASAKTTKSSLAENRRELRDILEDFEDRLDNQGSNSNDEDDESLFDRKPVKNKTYGRGVANIVRLPGLVCLKLDETLRYGDADTAKNDNQVAALQTFLKATGDYTYPVSTGHFGLETRRAVTRFQTRLGISPAMGLGVVESTTKNRIEDISCDNGDDAGRIGPATLVGAFPGTAYSARFTLDNTSNSANFVLESGMLPRGMYLFGNTLSGVPTTPGVSTFTVAAVGNRGVEARRTYMFIVNDWDGSLFGP